MSQLHRSRWLRIAAVTCAALVVTLLPAQGVAADGKPKYQTYTTVDGRGVGLADLANPSVGVGWKVLCNGRIKVTKVNTWGLLSANWRLLAAYELVGFTAVEPRAGNKLKVKVKGTTARITGRYDFKYRPAELLISVLPTGKIAGKIAPLLAKTKAAKTIAKKRALEKKIVKQLKKYRTAFRKTLAKQIRRYTPLSKKRSTRLANEVTGALLGNESRMLKFIKRQPGAVTASAVGAAIERLFGAAYVPMWKIDQKLKLKSNGKAKLSGRHVASQWFSAADVRWKTENHRASFKCKKKHKPAHDQDLPAAPSLPSANGGGAPQT